MKRTIVAALAFATLFASTVATQNVLVPTRPAGDSTNAAASTAFVNGGGIGSGVITGSNIAAGTVANSNLANMATATMKCKPIGSVAGAPQDCSYRTYNVVDYGADPTGATNNFGASFNSAMTQCYTLGNLGAARNGTVYIPNGFYRLGTTTMNWLPGCNIVADHAAYVVANTSITVMLTTGVAGTNTIQDVYLEGGQWDCNANVTQDGFRIQDFARVSIAQFRMYNCSGNAGNGSIGGFIRLGAATALSFNDITINHSFLFNFTTQVPSLVTGNYGIFNDPSGQVTDSLFTDNLVAGTSIGFQGICFDCIFYNNHTFVISTQGNMVHGFQFTSGQIRMTNNQCDGPVVSGNGCYDISGSKPYTLVANGFFEGTNNNVSNAVNIGSGTIVKSYGNHWIGNTSSNKILTDYTGTLTNLTAIDDYRLNVSTNNGTAFQAFTATPTCGSGSITTNSARQKTIANTTNWELDVSITALGSCTNVLSFTLPSTTASGAGGAGRDGAGPAGNVVCAVALTSSSMTCQAAANFSTSSRVLLSGVYENNNP